MISEMLTSSQITIPADIVASLGLTKGDQFEVFEQNGMICMIPVSVYADEYVEKLNKEAQKIREDLKAGKLSAFSNLDDFFTDLDA